MAIAFKKPQRRIDWETATHTAAMLVIKGLGIIDPSSAAKTAVSAYPTAKKFIEALKGADTSTPENRAWKWLSLTIAEAVAQFLNELRAETILSGEQVEPAVKAFLEGAMKVPEGAMFDGAALEAPSTHDAFNPARQQVPELIKRVTTWADFDTERWQRTFDDCLVCASAKMIAACHDDMKPLVDTVSGPAGEALRRNFAWAKHYEWIDKRFCLDPVFSPDGSVTTPLSQLYIRLRCYWHEEYEVETERRQEPKKRWKAHLGGLHETVEDWLAVEAKDNIRVVAGGPGSGKSSFAKALASEVSRKGHYRVVFLELQRMALSGNLYDDIGTYLHQRNSPANEDGSPGFPDNALDWAKQDRRPLLLIFDGLDEITADADHAKEIARHFVLNAKRLVDGLVQDKTDVRALVLGRNAACQDGLKDAVLPLQTMLNVAPIRTLRLDDLLPAITTGRMSEEHVDFPEITEKLGRDLRSDYWEKWQSSQGGHDGPEPEAITHEALSDLNVEPLLLHLLILSDFCGDRWQEAAENRNLVYDDILAKIHERNAREGKAGHRLSKDHFVILMECLGLAAWRGNLRTGTERSYEDIREVHARALKSQGVFEFADMQSMVLQTHARKVDGVEPGFEFIHKSFGEYLTARGLVSLGYRTEKGLQNADFADEETLAGSWVKIVYDAELTFEVIRFIRDEVRLQSNVSDLKAMKSAFETMLTWVYTNGMPVSDVAGSFRQKETVQRCAESAMLAVGTSTALHLRNIDAEEPALKIAWDGWGSCRMLHRIHATSGATVRQALNALDLSGSKMQFANFFHCSLEMANLSGASLNGATLSGADLNDANLSVADLKDANLSVAHLNRASLNGARLSGADLNGADLIDAKLSGADLSGARLSWADLSGADLSGANLSWADLSDANLSWAHLNDASLSGANLNDAHLSGAHLNGADLNEANLSGAHLNGANLSGAHLSGANLRGASLKSADLADCAFTALSARLANFSEAVNFEQDAVNTIFGVRQGYGLTRLPAGLAFPDFWHVAEDSDGDSEQLHLAYEAALSAWRSTL